MERILINRESLSRGEWAFDVAFALLAFGLSYAQLFLASGPMFGFDQLFRDMTGLKDISPRASTYVLLALTTLPLILRRIYTWPVFFLVSVFYFVSQYQSAYDGSSIAVFGPMLALFTVASERPRNEVIVAAVASVCMVFFTQSTMKSGAFDLVMRLQDLCLFCAGLLAGLALHSYQRFMDEAEFRAAAAEKGREEEAARRVEEERVRIARELHDITAHSLSAVSIQAAAAERVIDKDPEMAKQALATIRLTAKSSLNEIRSMIGVLRGEGEEAESTPTTGTDRMPDLLDYLRNADIEATFDPGSYSREGTPAYIDVALFGIAREAVTNIVRHSGAGHARIALDAQEGWVSLRIDDDGSGCVEVNGEGHGLQGIRERASLLQGTCTMTNGPDGGFEVYVRIPVRERMNHG